MPFDLITDKGLAIISRPLEVIVEAKPFSRISSVDIKVIVDLTKKLSASVEIEREDGSVETLSVLYPWLPPLCSSCGEIGHKVSFCPLRETPPKKNNQKNFPKDPRQHSDKQARSSANPEKVEKGHAGLKQQPSKTHNASLNPEVSKVYLSLVKELSAKPRDLSSVTNEGSNNNDSQLAPPVVISETESLAPLAASTELVPPVEVVSQEPETSEAPFTPATNAIRGRTLAIAPVAGTATSNAFNMLSSDTEPGVLPENPQESSDRDDLNFEDEVAPYSLVKGGDRSGLYHYSPSSSSGKKTEKEEAEVNSVRLRLGWCFSPLS